jgi:glucose-1-phosphate thymidylyltransferase
VENSIIMEPCFIGKGAVIRNSVVGPYVSVGENTEIDFSVLSNSIILNNSKVRHANLDGSMLGNFSVYVGGKESVNLGDYSEVK